MPTCIKTKEGATFYTDGDPTSVQAAINRGEEIKVWWFSAWGQRFREQLLLPEENVAYLITESDDG